MYKSKRFAQLPIEDESSILPTDLSKEKKNCFYSGGQIEDFITCARSKIANIPFGRDKNLIVVELGRLADNANKADTNDSFGSGQAGLWQEYFKARISKINNFLEEKELGKIELEVN